MSVQSFSSSFPAAFLLSRPHPPGGIAGGSRMQSYYWHESQGMQFYTRYDILHSPAGSHAERDGSFRKRQEATLRLPH